MSHVDAAAPVAAPVSNAAARVVVDARLVVALGFAVSLALCFANVRDIWSTGAFYDSDDAMRMVQARAFVDGQAWYDLTAWRLDPPAGVFMHWSRLVDLPLAALMKLFGSLSPGDAGERLARIAFPLGLQAALLAAVAWLARLLLGARGVAPAIALAVLSGFMFGQFVPGRVDHHAPQIVLLLAMIGAMLAAFEPARAKLAAVSALCVALSLSISVENLLFILGLLATPPLAWVVAGAKARALLRWFAVGLVVAVPLCFAAFNAPSRWLVVAGDAFSLAHVLLAMGAALVCLAMLGARRWEASAGARAVFAIVAAALVGGVWAAAFWRCLADPFAGLDPLVRDIWLANVGEAKPAWRHFAEDPRALGVIGLPIAFGLAGAIAALRAARGLDRARWAALLGYALLGVATTAFMIRGATSLAPFALLGCAWLVLSLPRAVAPGWSGAGRAALALAATLPLSSIGWAMVLPASSRPDARADMRACLTSEAMAPLAALPSGLVLAPIDLGAHLLAQTPQAVVTAPYHRNNRGNRAAIDAFRASPDEAQARVRTLGARYVVSCSTAKELRTIAARAPGSLAARLMEDAPPEWLRRVSPPGAALAIYAPRSNGDMDVLDLRKGE